MLETINEYIQSFGLSADLTHLVTLIVCAAVVVALAWLAYLVTKMIVHMTIVRLISKTENKRDDVLKEMRVFRRLSNIAPGLVVSLLGPAVFADVPLLANIVSIAAAIYLVGAVVLLIDGLLNAGLAIYQTYPISRTMPITSFVQIAKLILYIFGAITVLSVVLGESPMTFIAGLGAMAAVLMFVFKDPILGFVAGIQLSANKMVAVGDWISMPKYGVDGDIMEIALTTVKIRNFDKTITTIPTQSLINDSFKNWRGMQDTGGRRIKRAVNIDLGTVKFCDADMLERFAKIEHISAYIAEMRREIEAHNQGAGIDTSNTVNGRHLTNLGTFRAYVEAYLRAHPSISDQFTFLIRQLAPSEMGVPIEVYVFTNTTNWVEYEGIQADIFDHLLAAVPAFDLKVFQTPSGGDFTRALSASESH